MWSIPAVNEPIILMGPMKVGKTTIGKLLAERINCSFTSLDRLERSYIQADGFDPESAVLIQSQQGDWAWYSYRRQFFAEAITRFLIEHTTGILELGGGHPILPDPEKQAKVAQLLSSRNYVVSFLPTPNLQESLLILKGRQKPERLHPDLNEDFLKDDRYLRMAKEVLYTKDKSPAECCDELMARFGISSA